VVPAYPVGVGGPHYHRHHGHGYNPGYHHHGYRR
jgi:hypothetical protein